MIFWILMGFAALYLLAEHRLHLSGLWRWLPILILLWATESRQQRARRWRRDGLTQQAIATRLGCSRSTVRRLLNA